MGPLALISDTSIFRPTIQIDYRDPKFTLVKKRRARHFQATTVIELIIPITIN